MPHKIHRSITVDTDPHFGQDVPIPNKLAARVIGHSTDTIDKAVKSQVIPWPTTYGILRELTALPVVTSARIDGNPIPVLRLGEHTRAHDPASRCSAATADTEDRRWIGYKATMTDDEVLAAADRWWPDAGKDLVEAARAYLIARAGWLVGLAVITGEKVIHCRDQYGSIHYDATLVARCTDALTDAEVVPEYEGSQLAELARRVLGRRILGGQGGTFTRLSGDR